MPQRCNNVSLTVFIRESNFRGFSEFSKPRCIQAAVHAGDTKSTGLFEHVEAINGLQNHHHFNSMMEIPS